MKLLTIKDSIIRYGSENHMLCVARGLVGYGVDVHAAFPCAPGTLSMISASARQPGFPTGLLSCIGGSACSLGDCPSRRTYKCSAFSRLSGLTSSRSQQVGQPKFGLAHGHVPFATFHYLQFSNWHQKRYLALVASQAAYLGPSPSAALDGGFTTELIAVTANIRHWPDEIGVLYNGIEIDPDMDVPNDAETKALRQEVRTELDVPFDAKLLLTTARLEEQKGHVDLLQIVPRIIDEFPDVIFVWAGDGPSGRSLKQQVQKQNLQRHVRLLGYRADISRLLRASDLFVFPSSLRGRMLGGDTRSNGA